MASKVDEYTEKNWNKDINVELTDQDIANYQQRLTECCDVLKQAYKDHADNNTDGWTKNLEEKQSDGSIITLYQKPTDSGLSYTKIVSTVNCSLEDTLKWSTNIENCDKYDDYFDKAEFFVDLTDKLKPNGDGKDENRAFALARSQIKGHSFVLTPREFVHLIGKEKLGEEHGNIALAPMTSVDCPHIPERSSHVRGFIDNQGSVFIPNEDNTRTTVINVNHINLNGWVPEWVMNLITNDVTQTRRMREAIHKDLGKN